MSESSAEVIASSPSNASPSTCDRGGGGEIGVSPTYKSCSDHKGREASC